MTDRPPTPLPGPVAMVIQRFRPLFGGQGVQVEELCRALAARGARATVLTAARGHATATERCDGYEVRRLRVDLLPGSTERIGLWAPTFGLRVLAALLATRPRPAVVHVHGPTDGLIGAWLYGRLRAVPVIAEMTLLGDDDPVTIRDRDLRLRRTRWAIYRRCDAWVAMSEAFLAPSRSAGLPMERVHVIPQGVDTRRFRPPGPGERASARAALGVPGEGPVVALVGSLIERKGIDLLLRAWPAVAERLPEARLLLVGPDRFAPGSTQQRLLEEALSALPEPARARIVRTGTRDDPETALRAADVLVLPSRREGFGSVIIEAMASGLPCVVAELPGITDMIFAAPGDPAAPAATADGVVVPQESPGAIARALLALLGSPSLASAIGAGGRARARARFELGSVADRYLELYRRLARSGAR